MTRFDALDRELDHWEALGRPATLWLRDDDACADSPALQRLLAIASEHAVPVTLAAIAATADSTLVDALGACGEASVVQHGYAHRNHAPAAERSAELGDGRDVNVRLDELRRGRARLAQAFSERFVPVLVPPWNRVGDALLPHLPAAGFAGLSCFGPRPSRDAAPGLAQVNAHVDPIAWRRDRAFIGADAALERIVAHLAARRAHACDADEPTGLLTHHLAFAGAAFDFVDDLLRHTRPRRAAVWLDAAHAFALQPEALICCR
jgi:peptidoglycan/xylan/chitin deacetylase (PgdA/CDA1 family)